MCELDKPFFKNDDDDDESGMIAWMKDIATVLLTYM